MSIILDTTQDRRNNNFLICYIRTVHKNYPATFFYGLFLITSETAPNLKFVIMRNMQKDGMEGIFHDYLVAASTDGANVMTGHGGGLIALLERETKIKKLFRVHCHAHKLNLVVTKGLREKIDYIEGYISEINNFFRAYKRRTALMTLVEANSEKFIELKKIFDIRWSSSQLESFKSIMANYQNLYEVLLQINADVNKNFDANVRQTACSFIYLFTQSAFYIMLAFISDILEVVSAYSLQYQLRAGTMIGQYEMTEKLIEELNALKQTDGPHMLNLYGKLACTVVDRLSTVNPCNRNYLTGDRINSVNRLSLKSDKNQQHFVDFLFNPDGKKYTVCLTNIPPLISTRSHDADTIDREKKIPFLSQDLRVSMIDEIIHQINEFFPEKNLEKSLSVLLPSSLPENEIDVNEKTEKLRELAHLLNFDYDLDACTSEFKNLMRELLSPANLKQYQLHKKHLDPAQFWKLVLDRIEVGPELRKVIHHVMSFAPSSAEAERGFSIFNTIKTRRTSRLSIEHADSRMRS